jgi:hypothetical protein
MGFDNWIVDHQEKRVWEELGFVDRFVLVQENKKIVGSCKSGNKSSGSVKCQEFLYQQIYYCELQKMGCAPCSYLSIFC